MKSSTTAIFFPERENGPLEEKPLSKGSYCCPWREQYMKPVGDTRWLVTYQVLFPFEKHKYAHAASWLPPEIPLEEIKSTALEGHLFLSRNDGDARSSGAKQASGGV